MKKHTGVAVALAAAILASGGVASSVITATPAQAAEGSTATPITTLSAPLGLSAYSSTTSTNGQGYAVWKAPVGVVGSVVSYTVTVKQEGKPDRILTTADTQMILRELTENTSYLIQVRANIYSPTTGRITSSPEAKISLRTTYFATSVKASAPIVTVSNVTHEAAVVTFKNPSDTVGKVISYNVTLRKGSEIIRRDVVLNTSASTTNNSTRYAASKLSSNSSYTVEVTANVVSLTGTVKRTSLPSVARFETAKSPYVSVAPTTVTVPYISPDGATIVWQKPAVTGSLVNYSVTVTQRPTTGSWTTNRQISPLVNNTRISGLKPNTAYLVEVVAIAKSDDGTKVAYSVSKAEFKTPAVSTPAAPAPTTVR